MISKLPDFELTFNIRKKLILAQTVKDLGVTLDKSLDFNEHAYVKIRFILHDPVYKFRSHNSN